MISFFFGRGYNFEAHIVLTINKFYIAVFLFLLIVIPFITFTLQKKSSEPSVTNFIPTIAPSATEKTTATITEFVPVSESPQDNQQLTPPPFYPGLSWTLVDKQELKKSIGDYKVHYSSKNHDGNFSLSGKEWVGVKQKISQVELNKMEGDFTNYYNDKLTKLGWESSTETNGFLLQSIAADGPSGGIWGYVKVENETTLEAIILQKETPTSLFSPPEGDPDPCPCDITFRIFVSNPQDLTKVLPTSP
ncbi:MAG: hypothetical protein HYV37_02840 [Candidatus Levyibacteriota bacterium]|nr:MAG: hypothetical protein HYV37_02840 [Candidatus Levybacteria bacterium]